MNPFAMFMLIIVNVYIFSVIVSNKVSVIVSNRVSNKVI